MMKKGIIIWICCCFYLSSYAQQAKPAKDISVARLEKKVGKDIQLLDVRTAKEFNEGRIENAVNFDVNGPDFEANVSKLKKNKPVYVYCRTGKKSMIAAKKLDSLGFRKIYNLPKGIQSWNKERIKKN